MIIIQITMSYVMKLILTNMFIQYFRRRVNLINNDIHCMQYDSNL